jgi:hypothetical protein
MGLQLGDAEPNFFLPMDCKFFEIQELAWADLDCFGQNLDSKELAGKIFGNNKLVTG